MIMQGFDFKFVLYSKAWIIECACAEFVQDEQTS